MKHPRPAGTEEKDRAVIYQMSEADWVDLLCENSMENICASTNDRANLQAFKDSGSLRGFYDSYDHTWLEIVAGDHQI